MNTIHLHGPLGEKFGKTYNLSVADTNEAIRALTLQIDGLEDDIREGAFQVIRGDLATGCALDEEMLGLALGDHDLHLIPLASGEGGGEGIGKVLLGAALLAGAFFFAPAVIAGVGGAAATGGMAATAFSVGGLGVSFGQIAMFGAMMALGGISQMLAPTPEPAGDDKETEDGYSLSQVNVSSQGVAIPPVFGRCIVGSITASSALVIEQMRTGTGTDGDDPYGGQFDSRFLTEHTPDIH